MTKSKGIRKTKRFASTERALATGRPQAYMAAYASTGNESIAIKAADYSPHSQGKIMTSTRQEMIANIVSDLQNAKISVGCKPQEIMQLLWDCAHYAQDQKRYRELVLIIQELNKMCGHYTPIEQHSVNVNVDTTLEKLRTVRKEYKEY